MRNLRHPFVARGLALCLFVLAAILGATHDASSAFNPTPSGTGFRRVTAGKEDGASSLVNLASGTHVTGTLPVASGGTGITSLATGIATFLGTSTSANLAAAVTNETGTGNLVFHNSPTLTTPRVNNNDGSFQYLFAGSAIAANRSITLPLLAASDVFVFQAFAQTLTNKTIDAQSNTITGAIDNGTNGFRCSLTTAVPVTITDVATATSIFIIPYTSGSIAVYNGTQWIIDRSAEISVALGTITSGKNYDVFAYDNAGTLTGELSAAWTSDVARADALAYQNGVLVKSGTPTRRYLCTFRTISTTQTTDTISQRYLWNMNNRVSRSLRVVDTTDSWTYVNPNSVWRQVRAAAGNKFEIVLGQADSFLDVKVHALQAAGSASWAGMGVGIDSTTANSAQVFGGLAPATAAGTAESTYRGYPGLGYHAINWLETGTSGAVTYTFYGDLNLTVNQAGMFGETMQ